MIVDDRDKRKKSEHLSLCSRRITVKKEKKLDHVSFSSFDGRFSNLGCASWIDRGESTDSCWFNSSSTILLKQQRRMWNSVLETSEKPVNVQGGGSNLGFPKSVWSSWHPGTLTSLQRKKKESVTSDLVDHKVAGWSCGDCKQKVDVENLTTERLRKIFTGEVTNWKKLEQDLAISIINRATSSGSRRRFIRSLWMARRQCRPRTGF